MSINEPASPEQLLIETHPAASQPQPSEQAPAAISPNNPPWGVVQAVLLWFISVVFIVFVPIIGIIPFVVYKRLNSGSLETLGTDPNLIFISILGVIPAHILTFLVVWFVVTNRGRIPFWPTVGWHWPRNFGKWKTIGLAVLLYAAAIAITKLLGGAETPMDQMIKSSLQARFATAFLAAFTAPLVEELVYRGVIYSALQRALDKRAAVVIVSFLFAGVHVWQYYNNLTVIAVIFLLSISLTLARASSGSLLPSYVMHLVFNTIQAVLLVLEPFVGKPATENQPVTGFLVHTLARLFT